jgi:hypothetical protein
VRYKSKHGGKESLKEYIAIEVYTGVVRDFDSLEYAIAFKESFSETMTLEIYKKVERP